MFYKMQAAEKLNLTKLPNDDLKRGIMHTDAKDLVGVCSNTIKPFMGLFLIA